jgi:selenocysteine lyase/cysteine desulfurase
MGFEKDSVAVAAVAETSESIAARYRNQFPVTKELIYLNHAAVAPLCRPAAQAIKWLADDSCEFGSLHYDKWLETYDGLRRSAARLINASPDEIAIVKNTSEGIAMVANGFEWKSGDRVIAFREEFPSNYYPWLRLENKGVQVTWFSIYDSIETIVAEIPGAKLLAISFVNYLSGYRVDLDAIGRACHENGCFFLVDAIQGMGALPIDVESSHIDALAADGHKWMLASEGTGVLYIRCKWLETIEPVEFGWMNPANYADYSSRDMTLPPDAKRFECGTLSTPGCFGLRAALDLLLDVGIENITQSVLDRAEQLEAGARRKGYEVIVPRTRETGSGIVSIRHPNLDARLVVSQLRSKGISAAPRQGWVRMSPHFYISAEDIDQVLEALPTV